MTLSYPLTISCAVVVACAGTSSPREMTMPEQSHVAPEGSSVRALDDAASSDPVDAGAQDSAQGVGATVADNRAWCLAQAAKPGPSDPCELPRDKTGRPDARPDHTVTCGHLMTPVCRPTEFCSPLAIPGQRPEWTHTSGSARVFCYPLPVRCLGQPCSCAMESVRSSTRCPRGFSLACGSASPMSPDLTVDCMGNR